MGEREKHRRHHDPKEGESRPGERDPHESLSRPEDETPDVVSGKAPEADGMGGRPPARGERHASRPMPDSDD